LQRKTKIYKTRWKNGTDNKNNSHNQGTIRRTQ
jgi:hypothetical protein